jgi:hypothetical protein
LRYFFFLILKRRMTRRLVRYGAAAIILALMCFALVFLAPGVLDMAAGVPIGPTGTFGSKDEARQLNTLPDPKVPASTLRRQTAVAASQGAGDADATPALATADSPTGPFSFCTAVPSSRPASEADEAADGHSSHIDPDVSFNATLPALTPGDDGWMNVALISHGWHTAAHYHDDNTIKGPVMSLRLTLAGLLQHTTVPTRLFFVVGPRNAPPIARVMRHIRHWVAPLRWTFVYLNETQLDGWMDAVGHRASHRTGRAGNVKYFYSELFPHLDRVLLLDSDVLIAHDLADLWAHFARFTPRQLYAMAPQWGSVDAVKDNQFNAGVMLHRLDRMRAAGWINLTRRAIDNWHAKGVQPPCCTHGDQTKFHMVRYLEPESIGGANRSAWIPRHWNINKCHQYQGLGHKVRGDGTAPRLPKHMPYVGLVHLGCCKQCTRDKIGPRWALVLDPLLAFDLQHEFDSATPVGRCRYPVKQMQAAWTGAEDLPSESEEASLNATTST